MDKKHRKDRADAKVRACSREPRFDARVTWRDVPSYEGRYQISNYGRLRSLDRFVEHPPCSKSLSGHCRFQPGKVIAGSVDRDGYRQYILYPETKRYFAHTLVLLAFIGPKPQKLEVRHLDGNPKNNFVRNLKYGTTKENAQDRELHGRGRRSHGR